MRGFRLLRELLSKQENSQASLQQNHRTRYSERYRNPLCAKTCNSSSVVWMETLLVLHLVRTVVTALLKPLEMFGCFQDITCHQDLRGKMDLFCRSDACVRGSAGQVQEAHHVGFRQSRRLPGGLAQDRQESGRVVQGGARATTHRGIRRLLAELRGTGQGGYSVRLFQEGSLVWYLVPGIILGCLETKSVLLELFQCTSDTPCPFLCSKAHRHCEVFFSTGFGWRFIRMC